MKLRANSRAHGVETEPAHTTKNDAVSRRLWVNRMWPPENVPEAALAAVMGGISGLTIALLLATVAIAYTSMPLWDYWHYWLEYSAIPTSGWLRFLFGQHNEHRIAVPRLFFLIDHHVFSGNGVFLFASIIAVQAGTAALLWRLARSAGNLAGTFSLFVSAALAGMMFSSQQFANFTWTFQIQFVGVYFAAAAAIAVFALSCTDRQVAIRHFVTALLLAVIATYTMANGMLVWPVLVLLALCTRMPLRYVLFTALAGALASGTYFYGYKSPAHHTHPFEGLLQFPKALAFTLTYLGSPLDEVVQAFIKVYSVGAPAHGAVFCSLAGASGIVLLVRFTVKAFARPMPVAPGVLALLHINVFIVGSAFSTSLGRMMGPVGDATTSRYTTPGMIFWAALFALGAVEYSTAQPSKRLKYQVSVIVGFLLVVLSVQPLKLYAAPLYSASIGHNESALAAEVFDEPAWQRIFWGPKLLPPVIKRMREEKTAIFSQDHLSWLGDSASDHFRIVESQTPDKPCNGLAERVAPISPVDFPELSGSRIEGWAVETRTRIPDRILFVDDTQKIAGWGRGRQPRADSKQEDRTSYVGWVGYVHGTAGRRITALALLSDGTTGCRLNTVTVPAIVATVPLALAGPVLTDVPVNIEASWALDGYHSSVPRPQGQNTILYGSFNGADTNTGRIRVGPFATSGTSAVAIPFVTGPASDNLSLKVIDADTGSVINELSPVPVTPAWQFWKVALPSKTTRVQVLAEDQGQQYGQWLGVGVPHLLR